MGQWVAGAGGGGWVDGGGGVGERNQLWVYWLGADICTEQESGSNDWTWARGRGQVLVRW